VHYINFKNSDQLLNPAIHIRAGRPGTHCTRRWVGPQSIGCGGEIKIVSSCQELNTVHPEGGAFYCVGYTDRLSCAFPTNICTSLRASFNLPCLWL